MSKKNITLEFKIGTRSVGDNNPCFFIAEIGSNYNQDFDLARKLIDKAVESGVDAVKFQTFRANEHYSKLTPGFGYLKNADTHKLIKSLEIDRSWHAPLKDHAEAQNIEFFSSPCDYDAIDELSALGVCAYKLASFDLPDTDLIEKMAAVGKPIILSTGMADQNDIKRGLQACFQQNNDQIILLQCTSLYPAPTNLSNLRAMAEMRKNFGVLTGYSDHTEGDHIALAAAALGACVIEKHFTLDRSMKGPDHIFSIEPDELKNLIVKLRDIEAAMGDGQKNGPRSQEKEMYEKGRRSLHANVNIEKGSIITNEMLCVKRPGLGLAPHRKKEIIGKKAKYNIPSDQWIDPGAIDF